MIRAIFLDVDGTLISFRTHRIPDSTLKALAEAHRRGVKLFIASGRATGDLADLEQIPYDGVAALNGADCVMRDARVIARHPIPQHDFDRAIELAAHYDFPMALELDRGIFVNRVTPVVEKLAHLVAHPIPEEVDLPALFSRSECCQLCFYCDLETEQRVMSELPGLAASRWCPIFADINVRGVDKATGIAEFATFFGFAADEIMAIGDGGNDVSMLRAAGVGVAMGNACAEALAAADYVTADIDDDGIRRALEHFQVI